MRLLLVTLGVLCGCSSEPESSEDAPLPTLESIQAKVFTPRCSEPGCHGIDFPRQGVALFNSEVSASTMINKPPTIGDSAKVYRAIVAPGDPEGSFLIAKITAPRPSHGLRMPQGGDPLGPRTVEAIRKWIASLPK